MTVAAGSDTQIQYNTAGDLDASPKLTWNNTTNVLTIGDSGSPDGEIRCNGYLEIKTNPDVLLGIGEDAVTLQGRMATFSGCVSSETSVAGSVSITGGPAQHEHNPNGGYVNIAGGSCTSNLQGTSTSGFVLIEGGASGGAGNTNTGGIALKTYPATGTGTTGNIELIATSGNIIFSTLIGPERARFNNSGQLLLGTNNPHGVSGTPLLEIAASTAGISPRCFTMSTDSNVQFIGEFWNKSSTSGNFVRFGTGTTTFTQRGSITYSNNVTNYNTTSDAELKTEIEDSRTAGDIVDKIKVRSFKWKDTGKKVDYWVLAQELYPVCPTAVTPGSKTSYWEVDVSKLVPVLVKEVQELRARVAKLEKKK